MAVVGTLAVGGCAVPLGMGAKNVADGDQTGSIAASNRAGRTANPVTPPEVDLAYARAVAAEALAHGAKDNSIPWENPHTGAGGNITPLAASYTDGAFICRDFLASYMHGQSEAWLQGEACRTERGKWEVKNLKPLKQG